MPQQDTLPWFPRSKEADALARTTDPLTSHDAAARTDNHVATVELRIMEILRRVGTTGATTKELARYLKVPRDSISPRMKPMECDRGLIRRTDTRRLRAIVWIAAAK